MKGAELKEFYCTYTFPHFLICAEATTTWGNN